MPWKVEHVKQNSRCHVNKYVWFLDKAANGSLLVTCKGS